MQQPLSLLKKTAIAENPAQRLDFLRSSTKSCKKYSLQKSRFFLALRTNLATESEKILTFTLEVELSMPFVNVLFELDFYPHFVDDLRLLHTMQQPLVLC